MSWLCISQEDDKKNRFPVPLCLPQYTMVTYILIGFIYPTHEFVVILIVLGKGTSNTEWDPLVSLLARLAVPSEWPGYALESTVTQSLSLQQT